jgi:hypothetical protein
MKRFALIPVLAVGAMYAQAPETTQKPSPEQTGQAHIATPTPKAGASTTGTDRKPQKTTPPRDPAVKAPITNPANGPVGTPTNPTPTTTPK